jgi:pilus assembly protein CpaB
MTGTMNRRIVLVAAAVVLALVGTFAVYSYAHNADQRAVAGTKATTVLVATSRVPAGTSWAEAVKKKYFTPEKMPSDSAPQTALASVANAAIGSDAVAQSDIAPGQIVLRESFAAKTATTGVLSIPKGDIAISFQVGSDADVAGFVGPGSEVIIFLTSQLTGKKIPSAYTTSGATPTFTKTVVPRANVLATSQAATTQVAGSSSSSDATSGGTVLLTIALSQKDAERVILSEKIGTLYLGLLSATSRVSADPGVLNIGSFQPVPVFVK